MVSIGWDVVAAALRGFMGWVNNQSICRPQLVNVGLRFKTIVNKSFKFNRKHLPEEIIIVQFSFLFL